MSDTNFQRGRQLGDLVKSMRDAGDNYDCRWDLADEAKSNTPEGFEQFMRGLNSAFESKEQTQ